jgi:sugar phosphate isomerase/epimerase
MRPGVAGLLPGDFRQIDEGVAARVRAAGFTGVSCFFSDPLSVEERELVRLKTILNGHGVQVAQTNGAYPVLVHPDEAQRHEGVRRVQRMCEISRRLDAGSVYVRPGSLNPAGGWTPHPQNTHPATIERLIRSLKEIAPIAESEGVTLAIEGGTVSPLDAPERVREVIEAVRSPALRFNADPVNFIGTLKDVYDTTAFLTHFFDVLGEFTVAGHAKDIAVGDCIPLQFHEVVPGEGLLDYETFLRRFETARPDGYLLIEHLGDSLIPQAKAAIDAAMKRAGLEWR